MNAPHIQYITILSVMLMSSVLPASVIATTTDSNTPVEGFGLEASDSSQLLVNMIQLDSTALPLTSTQLFDASGQIVTTTPRQTNFFATSTPPPQTAVGVFVSPSSSSRTVFGDTIITVPTVCINNVCQITLPPSASSSIAQPITAPASPAQTATPPNDSLVQRDVVTEVTRLSLPPPPAESEPRMLLVLPKNESSSAPAVVARQAEVEKPVSTPSLTRKTVDLQTELREQSRVSTTSSTSSSASSEDIRLVTSSDVAINLPVEQRAVAPLAPTTQPPVWQRLISLFVKLFSRWRT